MRVKWAIVFQLEGFSREADGPLTGALATFEKFKNRMSQRREHWPNKEHKLFSGWGPLSAFYKGAAYNQAIG